MRSVVFRDVEVFEEFGAKEEERDAPHFIDECRNGVLGPPR
jgi:hypothetical protein